VRRLLSSLLAASVLVPLLGACGSSSGGKAPADAVATENVSLKDQRYNPPDILIKAGQTVTWTWNDGDVAHDVRSSDGNEPYGSKVQSAGTFTHVFSRTGTFHYFCSIHPNMKGTVKVS
jgi:plastocyanin